MTVDLEELKINFNAVLTSGGGRLAEGQFLRDYKSLIGNIPFEKLGHRNLRSLIQSLGGFYYTRGPNGEECINAGYDEKTAHISSLIARQKRKPGVKSKRYARSRLPPRPMLRRPTSTPYNYRPLPNPLRSTVQVQRCAPPPKYGNPPIVPQRQPLLASTSQIEPPPSPNKPNSSSAAATKAQDRLSHRSLDVEAAQTRIVSVKHVIDANISSKGQSSSKVPTSDGESREDASYVDIQWLQGKVLSSNGCRLTNDRKEPVSAQPTAFPKCSALVNGMTDSISYPASVNGMGMTNGALSSPSLANGMTYGTLSSPTLANGFTKGSVSSPLVNGITDGALANSAYVNGMTSATLTNPSMPSQSGVVPLMSLSVQIPSIQSSQTQSPKIPKPRGRLSHQQVVFKSHVEELLHLTSALGLEDPEYKYIERKPKREKAKFIAKLKIGELVYSSYPDEKLTCEEAQEFVAEIACGELRQRPRESEDLDDNKVLERVYKIVQEKDNGMVDTGIVKEYEKIYGSSLPVSWLEIIGGSSRFAVEPSVHGRATIVYPISCGEDQTQSLLSIPTTEISTPVAQVSNVSSPELDLTNGATITGLNGFSQKKLFKDINANTVRCGDLSVFNELPKLVLPQPKDGCWDVFVASVSDNENKLWVRFIGDEYDAKYNDLMTDMEIKMFTRSEQVPTPVVNHYYCCKFDNNWLRVQLKEIVKKTDGSEDGGVVFLIDNGEVDHINLSELRVLDKEYLRLPGQAVTCTLAYVDVTYEEAQTYVMNNVIGTSFVAEVLEYSEVLPKVVLYNTENEGEAVNINFCILDTIVKSLHQPQLQQGLNMVRISHIEKETRPFVQIQGKDLFSLENALDDISLTDLVAIHGVNAHPRLIHMDSKHLFIVRSRQCPQKWRRGMIVNHVDQRNPIIHFVDYGYQERVLVSDIFDLQKVLPPLCKFPIQALQVNLYELNETRLVPGVVKRLRELASPEFVIGKVDQGDLKLFKRIQPDNLFFSINDSIVFSYDDLKNIPDTNEEVKADATATCGSSSQDVSTLPLATYQLPKSEFFNVHVSMSSNPYNFMVQPVEELQAFNLMMANMQEYYEASQHIMSVPAVEELQERRAFAAKHPDDLQWYRVSIVGTLNQNMVSVQYSDYGDLGLVAVDRLRFLETRFKEIPALAIKATLHGIKPLNYDWSVEETMYFNNLVEDKSFPSVIKDINENALQNTWRVSLTLIDTSQDSIDVDIADDLIQQGYAVQA